MSNENNSEWLGYVDQISEHRASELPGSPQQVNGRWVWYIDGGREPFRASSRAALIDTVLSAVDRLGVAVALEMDATTAGKLLECVKRTETFDGLLVDAIRRAREIEDEYQPAYGVTVSSADDGVTYCTIIDGVAE